MARAKALAVFCALLLLAVCAQAQWVLPDPVKSVDRDAQGITLTTKNGMLRLQVCTDSMVHVVFAPGAIPNKAESYIVVKSEWPPVVWDLQQNEKQIVITTARMKVTIDRAQGSVQFADLKGNSLYTEQTRTLTPVQVNGEQTFHAESFVNMYGSREAIYGLGQHQAGVWNYRGEAVDLSQENTNIAVPFFVSSKGYGVLWNNASRSRFNNRFVHYLYLSSEVADSVDYYFVYGPELDNVIAGYRELTGAAPLFGKWAYGFWQSKNRYESQAEILGVAHRYRELKIPIDNIVQDWFWWNRKGEHVFNKNYPDPKAMIAELHRNNFHLMISVWPFFEPGSKEYEYMDQKHWFIDRTKEAKPPYHLNAMAVYDPFNPEARSYYWQLMDKGLFSIGADAWWLDTTEPETEGREENILLHNKVAIGSGARHANLFPLMTTRAVYEGQRKSSNDKRVFILSRSAFAGSQRYAVAAWSGDLNADWLSYKRQIPAGLNFSLSGLPYWTTDIGGFVDGRPDDPAYRELFIRWFEYGAFCPIFRTHGTRSTNQNELWSYGPEAQKILTSYDTLRYRLMPYIYSLAWKATSSSYTIMRPLAMDFPDDARALNIGDQFLFGPALMVNPVTEPAEVRRHVYLPKGEWYDFWTGRSVDGGVAMDVPAPLGQMPMFVRAGSIVPMGPEVQYATEKPADPIELRIYRGANGAFTLYEDENDNYNYERGAHATIPISWDEQSRTLNLGARAGSFPGMLQHRSFRVVLVGADHGAGISPEAKPDRVVEYSGAALEVRF